LGWIIANLTERERVLKMKKMEKKLPKKLMKADLMVD
jgi:hypothetical protein